MSEYNATAMERTRAEGIRRQYLARETNKMEQLQKLDSKVKTPGRVLAIILGILGTLIMGAGMSMVMVWNVMPTGIILGLAGLLLAAVAYPLYALVTGNRKKKYAQEIFQLSDALMGSGEAR